MFGSINGISHVEFPIVLMSDHSTIISRMLREIDVSTGCTMTFEINGCSPFDRNG